MMKIRKASRVDVPKILEFERNYMVEFEAQSLERWEQSISYQRQSIIDSLSNILVCEDHKTAGHIKWNMMSDGMHITSIYVDHQYRGKRLGDQLLKEAENSLRSECKEVFLETRIVNPARFLFEKNHYKKLEEKDGWIYYKKKL